MFFFFFAILYSHYSFKHKQQALKVVDVVGSEIQHKTSSILPQTYFCYCCCFTMYVILIIFFSVFCNENKTKL